MLLCYIYVALASYNTGYLTLGLESVETIVDEAANVATLDGKGSMANSWDKKRKHNGAGGSSTVKEKKEGHKRNGSEGRKEGKKREKELRKAEKRRAREGGQRNWKEIWSKGTDACLDVPLGGVCEVLYGEERDPDPEDVIEAVNGGRKRRSWYG